ncbi:MAG: voltage-gated chloride channel family protein [Sphingobacteriales bacterium]|nr:voltage-gated chloride channel family protein [Sphingobacteriales bacterium]
MNKSNVFKQLPNSIRQFYWAILILPIAITTGLLVAFFLWLLDIVTIARWNDLWLVFLLPLAGIFIGWLYKQFGKNSAGGNTLIIDEIHQPGGGVPVRMAPLVLFTTVITHLFGGSAGREGTAVQMGGSIAALFARWFKIAHEQKSILLMCGISGGFAAVFGTPIAGTIFAIEVVALGRTKYDAALPCFIASIIAHFTCISCGITHTNYAISYTGKTFIFFPDFSFNWILLLKVAVAATLFGLASFLFITLSHFIKNKSTQYISIKWLIPVIGGILVISICYALGNFDYIGLGVTNPNANGVSIVSAFHASGATYFSWFWKLLLTAITLGMGFKGGEVTPLFFIGATLGNILATLSGTPIDLFAAVGFIAVFAGATNTPLACTVMGLELFGAENIIYYATACFIAYYCSGRSSIYKFNRTITNE